MILWPLPRVLSEGWAWAWGLEEREWPQGASMQPSLSKVDARLSLPPLVSCAAETKMHPAQIE